MSALSNTGLLAEQAGRFGVARVAVGEEAYPCPEFPAGVRVDAGEEALVALASDPDVDLVVNALVGSSGLRPAAAAVGAGKRMAIANKESLVMAGEVLTRTASATGSELIPVDSEHSSLLRCLRGTTGGEAAGLVLTASGGPLRDMPAEEIPDASVEEVLSHPTWDMGPKVTVDSATLVNKAMEVVEARWLFDVPFEDIDVVIHKESVVHSLVRLSDGSLLAHLGPPDMRVPIQYALFYPEAPEAAFEECGLADLGSLSFEAVAPERYPCFGLVLDAARRGGTAAAIAAAADETAVESFLERRIRYGEIYDVIAETLDSVGARPASGLDDILEAAAEAGEVAACVVGRLAATA